MKRSFRLRLTLMVLLAVLIPVAGILIYITVVVQQALSEALAAIPQFLISALAIGLIMMALMAVLTWFAAGRMVRPIETLTVAATAVAHGDLDELVDITRSDEIGDLATAFNSMTLQLKGMIDNLEKRVSARTRDLALAGEVGRNVSEIRNIDDVLANAVHIIHDYFDLYFVQIYLVNDSGKQLVLKVAEGQAAEHL
ncbi:MAG: HAMP domain-containing protein [Chloroflexi bacterium]|nr:HAMP domain-containing protein [Chloroflexota bacterium]